MNNYYIAVDRGSYYIAHHGIIGMKHGVRNGPPYPLSDAEHKAVIQSKREADKASVKLSNRRTESELIAKTIPKNTKFYRVTNSDETLGKHPVFTYYAKADVSNIRAVTPWIMNHRTDKDTGRTVEKKYALNEDLNIPSEDEVREVMYHTIKNKAIRTGVAVSFNTFIGRPSPEAIKKTETLLSHIGDQKLSDHDTKVGKLALDAAFGNNSIKYRDKVISELEKRGYNAIYDNTMISAGNANSQEAYEPIIIFDGSKTLKEKSQKTLSANDVNKARMKNRQWMNRVNYGDWGRWQ